MISEKFSVLFLDFLNKFIKKLFWFNVQQKVSPKTIPKEKIILALKKNYGIRIDREIIPIISDSAGAVWEFGERPSKWLLKIYPLRKREFARVNDEVNLFKYLRQNGLCVPDILPTKKNAGAAVINFNKKFFPLVVMKYEMLKKLNYENISRSDLHEVGRAIAKLHNAMKNYPFRNRTVYGDKPFNDTDHNLLDIKKLQARSGKILSRNDIDEIRNTDIQLNKLLNYQKIFDQSTLSIVHGDLHLDQIAVLPNGEIYIFDFDDRFYGPIGWDLAIFCVHLYTGAETTFNRWEMLCDTFLNGYLSEAELKKNGQDLIKIMLLFRIRQEIHHYYDLTVNRQQEKMVNQILPRCRLARYLFDRNVGD